MVLYMAKIPIENIYYMLAYAYRSLTQSEMRSLATEQFDNIHDLFASILIKGVTTQVKRGLFKTYVLREDSCTCVRGKICISESIRKNRITQGQLICQFDEFSENNALNQILKATMLLLVKHGRVKDENKKALRKLLLYLSNVENIKPSTINWGAISYHRHNSTYRMLINVCWLVIKGLLLTTNHGTQILASFLDDQQMHKLYEKFVLGYYKQEHPRLSAHAAFIEWDIQEEDDRLFLPIMKSDITLTFEDKSLIIDTKYYGHTLQTNGLYGGQSIISGNLYQIYAYVKNRDKSGSGKVSGMLLYAKTDEEVMPNSDYCIGGNLISVTTLDLSKEWETIRQQLDAIVPKYLTVGTA